MRLLTHNYMQSNVRGTEKGYPLRIEIEPLMITQTEEEDTHNNEEEENDSTNSSSKGSILIEESPINQELVVRLLPKLNYNAILSATQQISECFQKKTENQQEQQQEEQERLLFHWINQLPSELPDNVLVEYEDNNSNNDDGDNEDTTTNEKNKNHELITILYHILFDIHIIDGYLICPDTKRKFPIKDGIPNMILHEDEV